jgi:hypothetical protein
MKTLTKHPLSTSWTLRGVPFLLCNLMLLVLSCAKLCTAAEPAAAKPHAPEAELIRTVKFNGFVANEIYPFDINGDGTLELLCLQSPGIYQSEVFIGTTSETPVEQRTIYCLTALTLDGKVLWQLGTPNLNFREAASHVADQMIWCYSPSDKAKPEIAVLKPDELLVLDAATGDIKRSTKLREDNYCIVIGVRSKKGYRLLVQNTEKAYPPFEYGSPALLYDAASLQVIANISDAQGSGHSPRAVNFSGDGDDELLLGYDAYDADGAPLWRLRDLGTVNPIKNHVDQLQAGYFGNPPTAGVVYAGSYFAAMGTFDGKLLWKKQFGHPQHVVVGNFRLKDKEACIAIYGCRDLLGEAQMEYLKEFGLPVPPKGNRNNIAFLNAQGEIVGLIFPPAMKYHSGEGILLYPQGCANGSDAVITRDWPWPEALSMAGESQFVFRRPKVQPTTGEVSPAGPGPDGYGVRIADFDNDGRAEILIHDQTAAWIYKPPFPKNGQPHTHRKLLPMTGQGNYGMTP